MDWLWFGLLIAGTALLFYGYEKKLLGFVIFSALFNMLGGMYLLTHTTDQVLLLISAVQFIFGLLIMFYAIR